MSNKIETAVQYGVGPIGERIVKSALSRNIEFVGAVDINPAKIGHDLGSVLGFDHDLGTTITDNVDEALATDPDIVFHSTVSSLDNAAPQLTEILESGCNVISTTEELTFPWMNNVGTAESLDEAARNHSVSCLGTGINPGFVMDTLPAVLSTPLEELRRIEIQRIQDASQRREPLQRKVGAGLSEAEFETEIVQNGGHVGSEESIGLLASAIGWELANVTESIEPVIAEKAIETDVLDVAEGEVAGVKQVATANAVDGKQIQLDLQMYVGAELPQDRIYFDADQELIITIDGGYHGDTSTAAVITNTAPSVVDAKSGLRTMVDIPIPSFRGGDRTST